MNVHDALEQIDARRNKLLARRQTGARLFCFGQFVTFEIKLIAACGIHESTKELHRARHPRPN